MPEYQLFELPEDVAEALADPICIPFPKADPIDLSFPGGGHIKSIVDFTDKIPTDCSMSFSLALQLGPALLPLDCIIKVLKLLDPLITIISNLGNIPKALESVPKFVDASGDVINCITSLTTPKGLACPLIDILRLIVKLLRCVIDQIKTLLSVIGGLALQIGSAQAAGNTALVAALECEQANVMCSAQSAMTAVEPITALLSLISPLLGIAGVDPIEVPPLADPESIEALEDIVSTLEEVVATIELVADGLGSLC